MLRFRSLTLSMVAVALCMLLPSCPPAGSTQTFPYYILNYTPKILTEVKMPDGATLQFTNVLQTSVPAFTMRIVSLSRAEFGSSLSEVEYKFSDGTASSISARITNGPGEIGFLAREFNGGIVGTLFIVDDDSKGLPVQMTSP